jgi:cytochrome c biogenesis protein
VFVPTAAAAGGSLESAYPAPDNPAVSLIGYSCSQCMNSSAPQSVYQLDTNGMRELTTAPHLLFPGQTWTLPGGQGKITFAGYQQWVSLAITYDPGQIPALVCGMLALGGLLLSFLVRRRRVFVRAVPAPGGNGSLVSVGGLARTDASGGFEDEFASLAAELVAADSSASVAPASGGGGVPPAPESSPAGQGGRPPQASRDSEPNNQSETEA